MDGINIVACQMCYFQLGNLETWLIDNESLLFFLYFSLVEGEIRSMTNNRGVFGCMIGESVDFKITLAFSLSATTTEAV